MCRAGSTDLPMISTRVEHHTMSILRRILSTEVPRDLADQIILLAVLLVIIPASSAAILWGLLPFYIGQ